MERPAGTMQATGNVADSVRLVYVSDDCEIDLGRRELRIRGAPASVGSRAFEIIEVLVQAAGELVTKNDLMDRIWPGAIVLDNTLRVHAAAVRKALGPYRNLLKTESGRGYRLLGGWSVRHRDADHQPQAYRRVAVRTELPRTNLPSSILPLIGRAAAVHRLRDLVSAYRVVTLTGPGGIGKSTLALTIARQALGEFADGGWLVELASLSDPGLVPSAVASALNLKATTISPASVASAIGERQRLLILDNCEHVIEAVASLVELLVRRCPRLTILATTRETLRVDGEFVYRVAPLDVPPVETSDPDDIIGHSAVELFIARTAALGRHRSPHAEDFQSIAEICRRLDGIPLAIEFAAARASTLGIQQVATGLRDRFDLLIRGHRTALPRHRTLRAALDWSYDLLSEPERQLLHRLAVFPSSFTLEAAVAVTKNAAVQGFAVMDNIESLVSKSLVTLDESDGVTRWSLLETIRRYAREKLAEYNEGTLTERFHAEYFRDVFALPALSSRLSLSNTDLKRRIREIDNIRAALDWCFSADGDVTVGIQLTAAYAPVWLHQSLIGECRDRCERALQRFDARAGMDLRFQMGLQIALASALIVNLGPSKRIETILVQALEIADALGDLDAQARALAELSTVFLYHRDYQRAHTALQRLRQVAAQIGDRDIVANTEQRVATRLLVAGKLREARQGFEHILESPISPEDQRPEHWDYLYARATARAMLARVLCLQGHTGRAHQEARASVDETLAKERPITICRILNFGLCRIAIMSGRFAEAEQAIARSIEVATRLDAPFWRVVGLFLKGKLLVDRRDFAEGSALLHEAFDKCSENGWRISYPEFRGSLAAAHLGLGETGEAFDAVNDAIDNSGPEHGQMWYLPELLRIKGEVLLRQASAGTALAAADCFDQARRIALEQGALFWELRVALSFTRLRMAQGSRDEARRRLVPVYGRFTDGFETPDLKEAQEILDALTP